MRDVAVAIGAAHKADALAFALQLYTAILDQAIADDAAGIVTAEGSLVGEDGLDQHTVEDKVMHSAAFDIAEETTMSWVLLGLRRIER